MVNSPGKANARAHYRADPRRDPVTHHESLVQPGRPPTRKQRRQHGQGRGVGMLLLRYVPPDTYLWLRVEDYFHASFPDLLRLASTDLGRLISRREVAEIPFGQLDHLRRFHVTHDSHDGIVRAVVAFVVLSYTAPVEMLNVGHVADDRLPVWVGRKRRGEVRLVEQAARLRLDSEPTLLGHHVSLRCRTHGRRDLACGPTPARTTTRRGSTEALRSRSWTPHRCLR